MKPYLRLLCTALWLMSSLPVFAAATIQLSVITLGPDGATFASTLSGVTGTPSCPSNTCTGVTVNGIPGTQAVSAVSIVGGNLQIALTLPLNQEDIPTITISSGSNLTDSGSNTATGQAAHAVVNSSEYRQPGGVFLAGLCRIQGFGLVTSGGVGGYLNSISWGQGGGSVDCNATGTGVSILAFDAETTFSVLVNGVEQPCPANCVSQDSSDVGVQTATGTSASDVWSVVPLVAGLTGTNFYQIVPNFGDYSTTVISGIRFLGGSATGAKPAAKPVVQECGDSNAWIGGSGPTNVHYDLGLAAYYTGLGISLQANDHSGAAVVGAMESSCPLEFGTMTGQTPAINILEGGSEDAYIAEDPVVFQAGYEVQLCNAMNIAACGNGNLDPEPALNTLAYGIINFPASVYNTRIQAAVTHVNATQGTHAKYIPRDGWINVTTGQPCSGGSDTNSDGIHVCAAPTIPGVAWAKAVNNEIPLFNGLLHGASYSFFCPSVATVNVSIICNLTLPLGATWNGTTLEPITLGDSLLSNIGAATILAVPSSGNSFTVSIQPWVTGTHVLTPVAGAAGWVDAPPVSITVSAQSPVPTDLIL